MRRKINNGLSAAELNALAEQCAKRVDQNNGNAIGLAFSKTMQTGIAYQESSLMGLPIKSKKTKTPRH